MNLMEVELRKTILRFLKTLGRLVTYYNGNLQEANLPGTTRISTLGLLEKTNENTGEICNYKTPEFPYSRFSNSNKKPSLGSDFRTLLKESTAPFGISLLLLRD